MIRGKIKSTPKIRGKIKISKSEKLFLLKRTTSPLKFTFPVRNFSFIISALL